MYLYSIKKGSPYYKNVHNNSSILVTEHLQYARHIHLILYMLFHLIITGFSGGGGIPQVVLFAKFQVATISICLCINLFQGFSTPRFDAQWFRSKMSPKSLTCWRTIGSWGCYTYQCSHPSVSSMAECALRRLVLVGAGSLGACSCTQLLPSLPTSWPSQVNSFLLLDSSTTSLHYPVSELDPDSHGLKPQ